LLQELIEKDLSMRSLILLPSTDDGNNTEAEHHNEKRGPK
jgi:hypothetical protein